jgi:hypothetical protein
MEQIDKIALQKRDRKKLNGIIKDILCVDICEKNRKADSVNARIIYSHILREMGHNLSAIGQSIGRDHATIIHYLHSIDGWRSKDADFLKMYTDVNDRFISASRDLISFSNEIIESEKLRSLEDIAIDLKLSNRLLIERTKELEDKLKKFEKFEKIYDVVNERTRVSDEEWVIYKIKEFYNGLYVK